MSGRKSCEVADLLQQGQKGRVLTEKALNSSIEENYRNINKSASEIIELQRGVEAKKVSELSADAKEMFGNESIVIEKNIKDLKNKILDRQIHLQGAKDCLETLKNLNAEISDCDNEATKIRNAIRFKSNYCDNEYNRAKTLNKRYAKNLSERKGLDTKARMMNINAANILQEVIAEKKSFDIYCNSLENMNKSAANRRQANELREQLKEDWKNIPADWANKFYNDEYQNISNKVKDFLKASDDMVIQNIAEIKKELNRFSNKLQNKINVWKKEKSEAEQVENLILGIIDTGFYDPLDYNNDGELANKIKLFDYIEKYKSTDYKDKFLHDFNIAKNLMRDEKFVNAKKYYDKVLIVADEAKNFALNLQENMIKKMELAKAIENVMYELNYDTETVVINDNPDDGFRVICKAGDEIIDFDNINFIDGKPVVDINHKESAIGDCHKSWSSIIIKMRENGIPMMDVTKNGESVVYNDRKQKVKENSTFGTSMAN